MFSPCTFCLFFLHFVIQAASSFNITLSCKVCKKKKKGGGVSILKCITYGPIKKTRSVPINSTEAQ